jgi:hypothetical protein
LAWPVATVDAPKARAGGIVDGAHPRDVAPNHQVDLAVAEGKPSPLVLAGQAGDLLPTGNRPDRDGVVVDEAESAVIVGLGGKAAERALRSPVALTGIGHLSDAAHGSLHRQAEHLACDAVGQLVQIESPDAPLTSLGRKKAAGLITTLKRLAKQLLLLLRWLQLELGNQVLFYKCSVLIVNRRPRLLPGVNAGVSEAGNDEVHRPIGRRPLGSHT